MKILRLVKTARHFAAGLVMGLLSMGEATAASILCQNPAVNHLLVSDASYVSACVDAGIGSINGNRATDAFLRSGGTATGYFDIGDGAFTQSGSSGTFSLAELYSTTPRQVPESEILFLLGLALLGLGVVRRRVGRN